jgi:hypothetical protein
MRSATPSHLYRGKTVRAHESGAAPWVAPTFCRWGLLAEPVTAGAEGAGDESAHRVRPPSEGRWGACLRAPQA